MVASIALYPDDLLTQLLMASTFPLEVVAAARWVEDPAHKSLSGDALAKALEAEPWDPSVKSLVPFPVVLATMNSNLTWLQQLGYAFATQQADVFAAVQRLRRLAQANDKLQSSPEQVVSTQQVTVEPPAGSSQPPTQQEVIVIQPAQPNTVYVPSYNPATVYGSSWPYPSYPPYYAAPPPGYYFGTALATGLAFAAGAAVVGGLWGWASPGWGGGYANVNVNRYNNINANRSQITSNRWGAGAGSGRPANFARAPGGPVGPPGRSQVSVPGNAVRPPTAGRGGVGGVGGAGRPGGPGGVGGVGGRGSAGRSRRRGRRRRSGSAGWSRRRGRCRRSRAGRAVRAAWVAPGCGSARWPGRAWRSGWCRPAGWCRVAQERRPGRPSGRLAEARASAVRNVRAGIRRHEQRTPGWTIRTTWRAEPIGRSAAIGRGRRAWRRWRRRRRWRQAAEVAAAVGAADGGRGGGRR